MTWNILDPWAFTSETWAPWMWMSFEEVLIITYSTPSISFMLMPMRSIIRRVFLSSSFIREHS